MKIPVKALASLMLLTSLSSGGAERRVSDLERVGGTYFAPSFPGVCRMMGSDGVMREFSSEDARTFFGPPGWKATVSGETASVEHDLGGKAGKEVFRYSSGTLSEYEVGGKRYRFRFDTIPALGGRPLPILPEEGEVEPADSSDVDIWASSSRLRLWFASPNAAGVLLAGLALVGAAVFFLAAGKAMWLGLAFMLLMLGGLVLTQSRGGMVAFAVGLTPEILALLLRSGWRAFRSRILPLIACLLLGGAGVAVTQGTGRYTADVRKELHSNADGNRIELWKTSLRMMRDAPRGWGDMHVGLAYDIWYRPLAHRRWLASLINDHLTVMTSMGWTGRWLWVSGWFALVLVLLRHSLRRGLLPMVPAVWLAFGVAAWFNTMMAAWSLWILPVVLTGWWTWAVRPWRNWRSSIWPLAASGGMGFVVCLFLFWAGNRLPDAKPSVRTDGRCVLLNGDTPRLWVVDDRETLEALTAGIRIRTLYEQKPILPSMGYAVRLADVPKSVDRLVLAGRSGSDYLAALAAGMAPKARELVFLSPPFGPDRVPQDLLANGGVRMLIGELAARYVDVYGEGPYPSWVTLVKGAELYLPNWPAYVFGNRRP